PSDCRLGCDRRRFSRLKRAPWRRTGHVWGDRYHAHALRSPREMRHALVYVVMNWRNHVPRARGFDPCSSAFWLDGWKRDLGPPCLSDHGDDEDEPPVRPATTWLASA